MLIKPERDDIYKLLSDEELDIIFKTIKMSNRAISNKERKIKQINPPSAHCPDLYCSKIIKLN